MKVAEFLSSATQSLKQANIESPRLETEMFLAEVLGCERSAIVLRQSEIIGGPELKKLQEFLGRRQRGEPIAYILGYRDFYRDRFMVCPGVLVPRNETEQLVEFAEKWLVQQQIQNPQIIDLGCGSGCLGLSLVKCHGGQLLAVDMSPVPVEVTRKNAQSLGVQALTRVVQARVQDLSDLLLPAPWKMGAVDVVLANPPYISKDDKNICTQVKATEPSEALFAEEDGLAEIAQWVPIIGQLLRPGVSSALNMVRDKVIKL